MKILKCLVFIVLLMLGSKSFSQDFVSSNIAPLMSFNIGVWFSPEIALQVGYRGKYFYTISDNDKHNYNFYYGDVLLNLKQIFSKRKDSNSIWNIIFHPGAGVFYNRYYARPNICGSVGLLYSYSVFDQFEFFFDISSIMGWDIYQGDEDILVGCVLGGTYSIR